MASGPNENNRPDLTLSELNQYNILGYNNMFSDCNLVTLSACETALTNDETMTSEYVGLVSGFLRSGATQVVSTLWTVESAASALVMIEFYRQRSLGQLNTEALATAVDWLRNLTAKDLQQWREDFLANLPESPDLRRKTLIEDSLYAEDWVNIEVDTKIYSSPYYWAAFIISGKVI
ncbi:MAG: CHAT domain-containing protein [Cyanobacteria bacterium J06592_8]